MSSKKSRKPVPPAKPKTEIKHRRDIRISIGSDEKDVRRAVGDVPVSEGHICFHESGGSVWELYYALEGKTPTIWKAKASSPVTADGTRDDGAMAVALGTFPVRDMIKRVLARRPSQIGVSLPKAEAVKAGTGAMRIARATKGDRKPSLLDLAADVLAHSESPMSAKDVVGIILAAGDWKTNGKTPDATLYAAMIREIKAKGTASRFQKAGPGAFALAKAA